METKAASNQLRYFNNILSVVVLFLALYIILLPILPDIGWWLSHHTPIKPANSVSIPAPADDKPVSRPKANTIIIPVLNLKQEIFDGDSVLTLNRGLWHLPGSSSPDKGGNTVIAGHRYLNGSATPFYHLDKVKVGDKITMYWQTTRYDYQVEAVKIVKPTQIDVIDNTAQPMLTLFTCTPLWTAKDRLIIQAKLLERIK